MPDLSSSTISGTENRRRRTFPGQQTMPHRHRASIWHPSPIKRQKWAVTGSKSTLEIRNLNHLLEAQCHSFYALCQIKK